MLTVLWAGTTGIREESDRALRCGRRDEHLAVERIEDLARAVKTETTFAALANDNAGYFVLRAVNRVSFGHGIAIAESCRRPLVDGLSVGVWRRKQRLSGRLGATTTGTARRRPEDRWD